jgi:peptidoglycan/LPS O-acetylase OafA/YrhL
MINRIYTIDYLRGVLAFLIMVYHYMSWQEFLLPDATSFLTRSSLYGVSLFFIISGFSLTVTYYERFTYINFTLIIDYWLKRFSRIYPLFWLIVSTYLILVYFGGKDFPSFIEIISNFTVTFALFPTLSGLTAGSWSIGIEIVFYIFFPFLIYFLHQFKRLISGIFIIFILLSMYISSYEMYSDCIEDGYWKIYMNLMNHVYFFIFGMLIALVYLHKKNWFFANRFLLISGILFIVILFKFYPLEGNIVTLLWQENRIFFSVCIFTLFILVLIYNSHIDNTKVINKILNYFGDISYTLYLLHPIIYLIVSHFFKSSSIVKSIIMIILTVLVSTIVHFVYEIKMKDMILSWRKNGK